jgi:hypothetical protein
MRGPRPRFTSCAALAAAAVIALGALSACGAVNRLKGPEDGASTEKEARSVAPDDPLARPTQVGWTSARATRCGFIFSPEQLRANYLAAETAAGRTPAEMQKIEKAYDYTRQSVLETINDDSRYCNKERLDAIRLDLNRYLAGDYTPSARLAR